MRRMLAMMLALILCMTCALGEGVQLSMQVLESEMLSEGALRALNTVLENMLLTAETQQDASYITLRDGEETVLSAHTGQRDATVTVGGQTAPVTLSYVEWEKASRYALPLAQELGALLSAWEKSSASTAELGDAGKPKTQLAYALTAEEWASVWPQVCDVLLRVLRDMVQDPALLEQAEMFLRNLTFQSKCTLKRYFAADGTEIGAYFYASEVLFSPNDKREVRLEYGYAPEKGLYLAFRCPNKKETRNVRVSVKGKTSVKNERTTYTLSADVRLSHDGEGDTYIIKSTLKRENDLLTGSADMNVTKKRKSGTVKTAVTLSPELHLAQAVPQGTLSYAWSRGEQVVMKGTLSVAPALNEEKTVPTVNAAYEELQGTLAVKILRLLQKAESADRQELLHYLAQENYLNGETIPAQEYDPRFIVMEETE